MRLNTFSLFIILYCSSFFLILQGLLVSLLGDGATTAVNILFLFLLSFTILCYTLFIANERLRTEYLSLYAIACFGILGNYFFHRDIVLFPEKYFVGLAFVLASAVVSFQKFRPEAKLPDFLFLGAAIIFAIVVLDRFLGTWGSGFARISLDDGISSNINYMPIAGAIILSYAYCMGKAKIAVFLLLVVLILLAMSQSRSAAIALVGTLLFVLIKDGRLGLGTIFKVLAAFVVGVGALNYTGILSRFTDDARFEIAENTGRWRIITDLTARFIENPYLGTGYGAESHMRYDPHNMFLEALLQGGVLGFMTMAPILLFALRAANRIHGKGRLGRFASSCLILVFVSGQFTGSVLLSLPLWLFIGLCFAIEKSTQVKDSRVVVQRKKSLQHIGLSS